MAYARRILFVDLQAKNAAKSQPSVSKRSTPGRLIEWRMRKGIVPETGELYLRYLGGTTSPAASQLTATALRWTIAGFLFAVIATIAMHFMPPTSAVWTSAAAIAIGMFVLRHFAGQLLAMEGDHEAHVSFDWRIAYDISERMLALAAEMKSQIDDPPPDDPPLEVG